MNRLPSSTAAIDKTAWLTLLEVNRRVVKVVLGVLQYQGAIRVSQRAAYLAGNTCDERVRRNDGLLRNDCSGGDDGALADPGVVQDGGADADEDGIFKYTSMHGGIVADRHHLANDHWIKMAHSVEHGTILDIAFGADADGVHISSYDRVHPHAGVFAQDDIADYLRRGIDITACWDDW
jgi:hypothetical protein